MTRAASAPGKVLLAGEYAVLEGWPALVCAVDRRAHARLMDGPQRISPFLAAVPLPAIRRVAVDTRALYRGEKKLGLGSSAAATVAAVAAALQSDDRARIHAIAHAAHAAAQEPRGSRGSGADVAAAVHGGLLQVVAEGPGPLTVSPLPWPAGLELVLVWTGIPADTPALVAGVHAYRARDPAGYQFAMSILGECAVRFPSDPIGATLASADLLGALGRAAGRTLVPPALLPVARLARAHGGAAKPAGAGGGDLVLSVFCDPAAAQAFRQSIQEAGMTVIPCGVDQRGVELAEGE